MHKPRHYENDSRIEPFLIKEGPYTFGVTPLFRVIENGHVCPFCDEKIEYVEGRNGNTYAECRGERMNRYGYVAGPCGGLFANTAQAFYWGRV